MAFWGVRKGSFLDISASLSPLYSTVLPEMSLNLPILTVLPIMLEMSLILTVLTV